MAQIDTSIVYPMQIGNYWEYWDNVGSGERKAETIVSDTIMPNGRKYFLFRDCYYYFQTWHCSENRYLRTDSNRYVYQYQYENPDCQNGESLLYDFYAPDSTFWFRCNFIPGLFWGLYFSGFYNLPFAPFIFETKTFSDVRVDSTVVPPDTLWWTIGWNKVSKGIGKVEILAELSPWYVLVGTILNGVKYGVTTSTTDAIFSFKQTEGISVTTYPNPFNTTTSIKLIVPKRSFISIIIYNSLGQKVKTLLNKTELQEGNYFISWNGVNDYGEPVSSGVYVLLFKATSLEGNGETFTESAKLMLLK